MRKCPVCNEKTVKVHGFFRKFYLQNCSQCQASISLEQNVFALFYVALFTTWHIVVNSNDFHSFSATSPFIISTAFIVSSWYVALVAAYSFIPLEPASAFDDLQLIRRRSFLVLILGVIIVLIAAYSIKRAGI